MSNGSLKDVKTMAELEKDLRRIVKQVRQTKRPVVVTSRGKPDMVLIDAATWERQRSTADLARLLAEGEADVAAGRMQPADEFFREFRARKKGQSNDDGN